MLKSRLPPLDPLIAFEAAARLLSFTRAAEELHLSQAAISQQIRHLEDSLQVRLFTRSHRAVQLTNEGREYQHTVAAILRQLAGATMDIKNVDFSDQLVIGCDQSFASCWLSSRLSDLRRQMPDVALRIVAAQVTRLEAEIDTFNADLAPLNSFVLPGGTAAAAYLHLARTITRRAERLMVELAAAQPVNPAALQYINRLSDHLFVLARHLNDGGAADALWVPGDNR